MDNANSLTPDAAVALVRDFLHQAADLRDAEAARKLMTAKSLDVPAFDPRGLAGTQYLVGDPIQQPDRVVVPVGFADAAGQQASAPLVVVLENGQPRIDVTATVELMMGGEVALINVADMMEDEGDDETEADESEEPPDPK